VPLLFLDYAADLARRIAARSPRRVLEIAAGTGVVTRALTATLPRDVSIVATDLQPSMIETASAIGTSRPVEWREADAMQLPFADSSFDAVVCQFGCMFFPDKAHAFAEARRVLRPGGALLFNTWDALEENDFSNITTISLASIFPNDPPRFFPRAPYAYYDPTTIERDVTGGGFPRPQIETLAGTSRAPSARDAAIGLCQGTPLRGEIEERAPGRLGEITDLVADAIAQRFGRGPVDGKIQALVVTVER